MLLSPSHSQRSRSFSLRGSEAQFLLCLSGHDAGAEVVVLVTARARVSLEARVVVVPCRRGVERCLRCATSDDVLLVAAGLRSSRSAAMLAR